MLEASKCMPKFAAVKSLNVVNCGKGHEIGGIFYLNRCYLVTPLMVLVPPYNFFYKENECNLTF